ncbi:PD-(D/E)XK nuclease family protein [Candidatus Woesearchaeota archaeon]|nr:PD-(D/E)XK nuclease family protein [Candidatus Woesearchaeota archaeon]
MPRIQSPSSINLYKQCPRKYYYRYILNLEPLPSIHTLRGNITHSVLQHFFDVDTSKLTMKNFEEPLKTELQSLLVKFWNESKKNLDALSLSSDQLIFYFEETLMMLLNWFEKFTQKMKSFQGLSFSEIFQKLTPLRELEIASKKHSLRGFIDAIEDLEGEKRVMDYKTSKRFELTEEYRLQLAIYALLYEEKHGYPPKKVGIYFLKDTGKHEHTIPVDKALLVWAKREVAFVHEMTQSDNMGDYPKNITPLCKYSTGQCDYYEPCMVQKTIPELVQVKLD